MRSAVAIVLFFMSVGAALAAPTPFLRLLFSSLGLIQSLKVASSLLQPNDLPKGKIGAFLFWFAWPGVLSPTFYPSDVENEANFRSFFKSWMLFLFGGIGFLTLLWATRPLQLSFDFFAWAALAAVVTSVHLGIVSALPQIYRALGYSVPLTFDRPWSPNGLLDFWSSRWNLPFVEASRFFVLKFFSSSHPRVKYAMGFLASGVMHEIALSGVARGGWGKPLLYFFIQWIGVLIEKSLKLSRAPRFVRLLYAAIFILGPIALLFHSEFRAALFLPLYESLNEHPLTQPVFLQICLTVAGVGSLLTLAAGIQVPARLQWREELKRLRPFNEKIFRTYYGYIGGTILFSASVTLLGRDQILSGGFLAVSFLTYVFLFWFVRILVDFFYFKHTDWPPQKIFFIGHVCLTTLFLTLVLGFAIPLGFLLAKAWHG